MDGELEEEIRIHLEMEVEANRRRGFEPREARAEAVRRFGGVEQIKEIYRDRRGLPLIETTLKDLRYAVRTMRKNPGFTIAAAVSLALGIGGNAALFSLVNSVLLRPLPFSEPDRLIRVTEYYPKGGFVAMREQSRTMDIAASTDDSEFNLTGSGEALHLSGSAVSANLFSVLGAAAERGRTFAPGEDLPGADGIVIISHSLWVDKFQGDPGVIGRPIMLDGVARNVIGVMPSTFRFPTARVEAWVPLRIDSTNTVDYWNVNWIPLVARLHSGATIPEAREEVHSMVSRVIGLFPFTMPADWHATATVLPLQQSLVGEVRPRLILLLAAVGFVLLIACANVASLLLARTAARQREMAIRAALGAGRGRILRQLLTESVVLALTGGALGLGLAYWVLEALKRILPNETPGLAAARIDWQVMVFMAGLALVTGMGFGLVPALSAAKLDLSSAFKTRGSQGGLASARLRSGLIAGEVALSVILVIGAGLLIKSLWLLGQVNPGFQAEHILAVRVYLGPKLCKEPGICSALNDELIRRARLIDGVSDAATANVLPLGRDVSATPVELEGHPIVPAQEGAPMLWSGVVTPDYFRVLRIPLLRGRTFNESDGGHSAPVAMVSAATARRYWPGEDAIGKHIRAVWDSNQPWRTVVGIVGDVRQFDLTDKAPDYLSGAYYLPFAQTAVLEPYQPTRVVNLVLKTTSPPAQAAAEIRALVGGLNPDLPVSEAQTLESAMSASTQQSRMMMWLFVCFGGSALILAGVGTYGVVSYSTAQRTAELGLRMALGATRTTIFGMILGSSFRLVTTGLVLGIMASLLLARAMASFVYGIGVTDPMTFVAVSVVLIGVALVAGYVPARRAASVDPLTALRAE